jgi:hypothetical protein
MPTGLHPAEPGPAGAWRSRAAAVHRGRHRGGAAPGAGRDRHGGGVGGEDVGEQGGDLVM